MLTHRYEFVDPALELEEQVVEESAMYDLAVGGAQNIVRAANDLGQQRERSAARTGPFMPSRQVPVLVTNEGCRVVGEVGDNDLTNLSMGRRLTVTEELDVHVVAEDVKSFVRLAFGSDARDLP